MIYQVDKSEYEAKETDNKSEKSKSKVNKKTEEEKNYVKISKLCNVHKIYGIFYSVNQIDLSKCQSLSYVSTANFWATLLDRINSVLYFTQEMSEN